MTTRAVTQHFAKRPRILYVTSHNPCGPEYGARIRVFNIGKILQRLADVSLVLIVSEEEDEEWLNQARKEFNVEAVIFFKRIPQTLSVRVQKEINHKFYGIRGQTVSSQEKNFFYELIRDVDLTWLHTVRIPDAIGQFRWTRSILDVDDLASQLYDSQARIQSSPFRRLLDFRMKYIWRRREQLFLKRFDILCVCSERDKEIFKNSSNVYVVRNGFKITSNKRSKNIDNWPPKLGFIGSLDYSPNRIGMEWFLKSVWPLIKKSILNLRLRLVGTGTDRGISLLGADVDGLGWISDTEKEISSWSAMIVPIRQGGGTRIKIAEGFARRCPVIATSFGAYGYNLENGKEAILADTPEMFSKACIDIIKNTTLRSTLTENAYKKYLKYYTWDAQADNIEKAISHCLMRNIA